ncbi:MAG: oxidoreductase, partial [Gammaproteobacteria bacterium]|nr:oxidoreductase [Gammaproteobacteria bacterium]
MSLLIARFRRLSAPFGIDIIYYFHRQVALLIALLLLAHVSTLLWVEPLLVYELLWLEWKITSGLLAVIFIV